MANILSVEKISKSYGERNLFRNVSFGMEAGEKVALVAANGSGKSTILRILAGIETPDEGMFTTTSGLKIGYLAQESSFDPDKTVISCAISGNTPVMAAIRDFELAAALLSYNSDDKKLQKTYEQLSIQLDQLGGWDLESKARQILGKLKLNEPGKKVAGLSGGQVKRLALANVLLQEPDLLLLDEPTNHLDLTMIEWLENYLATGNMAILLVTHDRLFLDHLTGRILEITPEGLYNYEGDYSAYLEKKAERIASENSSVEKAKNKLTTELEWMRRMPKARGTKSKSRIDAFYELEEQARKKKTEASFTLDFKMKRLGGKVIELKSVNKAFGENSLIRNFSYVFKTGEKIAIIGPNGTGKSTLLNLLAQKIIPDSGTVTVGQTVVTGYYTQSGIQLPEDKRIIELIKENIAEVITLENGSTVNASQFLTRFNFPPDRQYTFVSKLSGGEKRRLYLLTILVKNPNVLILDEPTNDLDLPTLQVLEEFLENFKGCLIIVSHDRFFTDRLADHLFVFEGDGRIRDFPGNYSQYREEQELEQKKVLANQKKEASAIRTGGKADRPAGKKFGFKEKREYELLEAEIQKLETEKKELETGLCDTSLSHTRIMEMSKRMQEILMLIPEREHRWLELSLMMEES